MPKKRKILPKVLMISFILIFLSAIAVGGIFIFKAFNTKPMITISGYYNSEGQPISEGGEQSVVGGVEGVKFITIAVNAQNKDTTSLTFKIIDASPAPFKTSLPLNQEKTSSPNQYSSWNSLLIDVEPFEGTTQNFCVTLEGNSPLRDKANKTACASIRVDPDPVTNFDIEIVGGSNNTAEVPPANQTTNPPQNTYVKFRTFELAYGGTNAVAYTASCGADLVAFGKTTGACTEYACSDTSNTLLVPSSSGSLKFWVKSSTDVCVCDVGQTSGYPKRYSTTDSDATRVSIQKTSIDPTKEVACT